MDFECLEEMKGKFDVTTTAGAEKTATVPPDLLRHLPNDKQIGERLSRDIRCLFKTKEDIPLESIKEFPYLDIAINAALRL